MTVGGCHNRVENEEMAHASDCCCRCQGKVDTMTSEQEELHTVQHQLDRAIAEIARLKCELLQAKADIDSAMHLIRNMNEVMKKARLRTSVPELTEGD